MRGMTELAITDPHLTSLLVDADNVDTQRLAQALRGRVGINSANGEPVIQDGYRGLSAEQKVMLLLLARLAASLLGRTDTEALSVKDVVAKSGLPSGTVAPALRKLATTRRLVVQDDKKAYLVARSRLLDALDFVGGND